MIYALIIIACVWLAVTIFHRAHVRMRKDEIKYWQDQKTNEVIDEELGN